MGARRQGMKVDCSASHHVALPTPADLLKAWAEPRVMNTHRALDQKSSIRALERKLSQLRLSQHGRQRRDSPPDRCPKPERYEQDQGQGRSRVRPIIRLLLVQRLGPQPQRTGATSKFVHQVPSIWCAPIYQRNCGAGVLQFLCQEKGQGEGRSGSGLAGHPERHGLVLAGRSGCCAADRGHPWCERRQVDAATWWTDYQSLAEVNR